MLLGNRTASTRATVIGFAATIVLNALMCAIYVAIR